VTLEIRTTKVSDKGQVAIPTEFQRKMGLKKGDKVVLMLRDGNLVLQKSDKVAKKLEKEFEHIQIMSESSLKKIWNNKKDDIWNEYLKE
jgi:AbrB family looped-hinge helix DNA binding protein